MNAAFMLFQGNAGQLILILNGPARRAVVSNDAAESPSHCRGSRSQAGALFIRSGAAEAGVTEVRFRVRSAGRASNKLTAYVADDAAVTNGVIRACVAPRLRRSRLGTAAWRSASVPQAMVPSRRNAGAAGPRPSAGRLAW
jgi:hypothetical protein